MRRRLRKKLGKGEYDPQHWLRTYPDLQKATEAIVNFGKALAALIEPHVVAFGRAAHDAYELIHAEFWTCYRAAGMPYGENEEGMRHFVREYGEARRAKERAIEEAAWQQALANLRKGKEIGH